MKTFIGGITAEVNLTHKSGLVRIIGHKWLFTGMNMSYIDTYGDLVTNHE